MDKRDANKIKEIKAKKKEERRSRRIQETLIVVEKTT
jgi:hypothetical protein